MSEENLNEQVQNFLIDWRKCILESLDLDRKYKQNELLFLKMRDDARENGTPSDSEEILEQSKIAENLHAEYIQKRAECYAFHNRFFDIIEDESNNIDQDLKDEAIYLYDLSAEKQYTKQHEKHMALYNMLQKSPKFVFKQPGVVSIVADYFAPAKESLKHRHYKSRFGVEKGGSKKRRRTRRTRRTRRR